MTDWTQDLDAKYGKCVIEIQGRGEPMSRKFKNPKTKNVDVPKILARCQGLISSSYHPGGDQETVLCGKPSKHEHDGKPYCRKCFKIKIHERSYEEEYGNSGFSDEYSQNEIVVEGEIEDED